MKAPMRVLLWAWLLGCAAPGSEGEERRQETPAESAAATELRRIEGCLDLYWDSQAGRLLLEVPQEGEPWLYLVRLTEGLGSNPVGLDRGQIGAQHLVEFRRVGARVLLVAPNTDWRTSREDPAARRAVRESFAEGVLHGFEVFSEEDGRVRVDATDFFLRDAHGIARALGQSGQGSFRLDASRSAIRSEELAGFPENTDVPVTLTFTGDSPGSEVRTTAAIPESFALGLRHSFVRLPDAGYRPRRFDPRSGYFSVSWKDLDAPVDRPLERAFLLRHRLQKVHPGPDPSPVVEPIVYYVDRAAPEPVRTALLEGARYWEPAFEAAGFLGGYRVELLPEGADPHDLRYNVIQWVHRSTRGWSYGNSVDDPRTGEILKGHVTLGALRVRQDVLLAEGLLGPYGSDGSADPRAVAMALDRIRQLSAHEVGHTLGLAHNFAGSADGRSTVMDYPAPWVRLGAGGELDFSRAYRPGCGEWDDAAIRYGYGEVGRRADGAWDDAAERAGLEALLAEAREAGLQYLSDADARGADRAHPAANLWDNGEDALVELASVKGVRRLALERFSEESLRVGRPWAQLEEVLVPLYLHHRYQTEAVARLIGGVDYHHAVRGDGSFRAWSPIEASAQRRALAAVLETLDDEFLALPPGLERLIPPTAPGSARGERFDAGALFFDPLTAAAASVELSLELLLDGERCRRALDQRSADAGQLGLEELFDALFARVWGEVQSPRSGAISAVVQERTLEALFGLVRSNRTPARVRARALAGLGRLSGRLEEAGPGPDQRWQAARLAAFLAEPFDPPEAVPGPKIPPGSPIGTACEAPGAAFPGGLGGS